ncbi:MAG: glucokinase [Chloroflexota bacterium]
MNVLAGDIGGTNVRLAVFSSTLGLTDSLVETVYPSAGFNSLEAVLQTFLAENKFELSAAAFVLAGPIIDDQVTITNLGWTAIKADIKNILGGIQVGFNNDLAGISNFIPNCNPKDLVTLNQGTLVEHGTKVVIAPGTGLGEGYLVWSEKEYRAQPSEGGHASFSPSSEVQIDLLKFMQQRYQHVSFERVCSGSAVPEMYEFVKGRGVDQEPEWLGKALSDAEDHTPVIIEAALNSANPVRLCQETVKLFVEILAIEAGNMALNLLARGGVYLAGGLSQHLLPYLEEKFTEKFSIKGRYSEFLADVPVYVVIHPQPGLYGAAMFAFELAGIEIN